MAVNCKTLIEAAYARSTANDPDALATDSELIGVIDRRLKAIYSFTARINKFYFAKEANVVGVAGSWALPTDAEVIFYAEDNTDKEVHIMSFRDKRGEMAPRVYKIGQTLKTVGDTGDPANTATLSLLYSYLHPDLNTAQASDHANNTLEANWPEQFNDLIVLRLSRYLAIKDGMREELAAIADEEATMLKVYIQHLQNWNSGVKGRFGHQAELVSPTETVLGGKEIAL